jgi:hypothetical protein
MSSRANNSRFGVAALFFAAALSLLLVSALPGQQGRREIVSDDFTRPRPTPTPKRAFGGIGRISGIGQPKATPRPIPSLRYRFVASSSPNAKPLTAADNVQQLGITLWRLRPAGPSDTGERIVVEEEGHSTPMVPARIELDTPLHAGDRIRLSIESPRAGYLYIFNRDVYANAQMGEAMMIFPTRTIRGGDNRVVPGKLIDLPAQEERQSYITVQPRPSAARSAQTGEVLTLIVTDNPLPLTITDQPARIAPADLASWEKEWTADNERYELEGGAGQTWTGEEREAARSVGSRQLTQTDSPPQTIFRIAMANKSAFLISLRLRYESDR